MKYIYFLIIGIILFSFCASVKVINIDDSFANRKLNDEIFIICPISGEWINSEAEVKHYGLPDLPLYLNTFCRELSEYNNCIDII